MPTAWQILWITARVACLRKTRDVRHDLDLELKLSWCRVGGNRRPQPSHLLGTSRSVACVPPQGVFVLLAQTWTGAGCLLEPLT
jgi:hypothetical protein